MENHIFLLENTASGNLHKIGSKNNLCKFLEPLFRRLKKFTQIHFEMNLHKFNEKSLVEPVKHDIFNVFFRVNLCDLITQIRLLLGGKKIFYFERRELN